MEVLPPIANEPDTDRLPLTIWLLVNVLLPVVANRAMFVVDKTSTLLTLLNQDKNNFDFSTQEGLSAATAKQYVLSYPVEQPANVYTSLTEQEKLTLQQEFVAAYNVYKSVQTFTISWYL